MYEEFLELLDRSKTVFALTGAGVSTLSGIPDFRGGNGVYNRPWEGRSVEEILSIECFRERSDLFYRWAKQFVYCCENYQPSVIHLALAQLEKIGKLAGLYTQNIDLLHTRAGNKKVYELHGSPAEHHCLRCGKSYSYAEIAPRVLADEVPVCTGCGGSVKPDIVFYGESLDENLLERADRELFGADLLLVLGTSLTVYPAAALPEITLRGGGKLVIVNAQLTGLDSRAAFKFDDLGSFGKALLRFGETREEKGNSR